jgi:hypothetical protein
MHAGCVTAAKEKEIAMKAIYSCTVILSLCGAMPGTFHFAHGEEFDREQTTALPEGSLAIMSPGDPMFGYTEEETVIQLHGTGPWGIEYINPEDDPRH